jgi:hypothetical protein
MIDIRILSKYYQYSLKDKVLPIRCSIDPEHPILVPNLQIDDDGNDIVYLYCIDCNFKLYPGTELLQNMKKVIEESE